MTAEVGLPCQVCHEIHETVEVGESAPEYTEDDLIVDPVVAVNQQVPERSHVLKARQVLLRDDPVLCFEKKVG